MKENDVYTVIGDSTRRHILTLLKDEAQSVNHLVEKVHASQPTVSKHLKVLRDAGLVTTRTQGRNRFYSLHAAGFRPLVEYLENFEIPEPQEQSEAKPKPRAFISRFSFPTWNKLQKE